jgi:uncharacterized protein (DUF1786 family)
MDIGRGTQDILLCRPAQVWENSIQLILPSPTALKAEEVREATRRGEDLFFFGETMGGGPLTKAVRGHLESGRKVWATPRAAATFDDDPENVRALGIQFVGEEEEKGLRSRRGVRAVRTGDVDLGVLRESLGQWGINFRVDAAAIAVQDHGRAPRGMSDRRFRFEKFKERLSGGLGLPGLAYAPDDLPDYLTRMQGIRRALQDHGPLLIMDTGFAALLGVLSDPVVAENKRKLLLNVGNGHTLAGVVEQEALLGFFEHHTFTLSPESLSGWLNQLVRGEVDNLRVFHSGGHGAFLREGADFPGWDAINIFAATGPRRALAGGLHRRPYFAAPHGQMMLTGNFGLFRAFQERYQDRVTGKRPDY